MSLSLLVLFSLTVFVFFLSYWTTRFLCTPTSKLYLLDHPNERSLHPSPTPRTGGLAILTSLGVGLLILLVMDGVGGLQTISFSSNGSGVEFETILWIMGTTIVLTMGSFWDDRAGLSPGARFGVHALSAIGIVWWSRMTIDALAVPPFGTLPLGWLAVPFTILFIMWMTNLYNFMDGMDGFAGGMTVIGFGFLSLMGWLGDHLLIALMSLLTIAASVGFLFLNLPPAKIFMGDVGSVPLGFLAGTLSVMGVHDGLFDIWVPVLIFSPFIIDATVTLFLRFLRGEKFWHAHRQHFYQRMVLAGWGHRRTVLAEYSLMVACGISAIFYWKSSEPLQLAILLAWTAGYVLLALSVKAFELRSTLELTSGARRRSKVS